MQVRFIGDANGDGPDTIVAHGFKFIKKRHFVHVPDDNPAARKLRGNGHFVCKDDEMPDLKKEGDV